MTQWLRADYFRIPKKRRVGPLRLANHHVASKHMMVRVLLLRDCDPLAQVLHKGLDFRSGHQLRKQAS